MATTQVQFQSARSFFNNDHQRTAVALATDSFGPVPVSWRERSSYSPQTKKQLSNRSKAEMLGLLQKANQTQNQFPTKRRLSASNFEASNSSRSRPLYQDTLSVVKTLHNDFYGNILQTKDNQGSTGLEIRQNSPTRIDHSQKPTYRCRNILRPFWDHSLQTRSIVFSSRNLQYPIATNTYLHHNASRTCFLPRLTTNRPRTTIPEMVCSNESLMLRYPRGQQRPPSIRSSHQARLTRHKQIVAASLRHDIQKSSPDLEDLRQNVDDEETMSPTAKARLKCERWLSSLMEG